MSTSYYPVILYPPLARRFNAYQGREHLKASFQGCVQLPNVNGTAKQGVSQGKRTLIKRYGE